MWSLHHAGGSAWLLGFVPGLTRDRAEGLAHRRLRRDAGRLRPSPASASCASTRRAGTRSRPARGTDGRWLHLVIDTLHADRAVWTADKTAAPGAARDLAAELAPAGRDRGARGEHRRAAHRRRRGDAGARRSRARPSRRRRRRAPSPRRARCRHRARRRARRVRDRRRRAVPGRRERRCDRRDSDTALERGGARRADRSRRSTPSRTVRAAATATHPAQSLDARALIRPLAAWPLGALDASVSALDLSAFAGALPATALTGEARVDDERHRRSGDGLDRARQRARRPLERRAASGSAPSRRAARSPATIPASSTCRSCRPSSARRRAPPAASSAAAAGRGRIGTSTSNCARSSRRRSTRAPAAPWSAARPLSRGPASRRSATAAPSASAPASRTRRRRRDLAGELDRSPRCRARAPQSAHAFASRRERARTTSSCAAARRRSATRPRSSTGRLARAGANEPWRATGRLELARFDPAPWWPGAADSPLARGANRLDAKGDFDLRLAATDVAESAYAVLAATTGTAKLTLADSLLAGIAIQGTASYANSDGRARPSLDLLAAGNRVQLEGTIAARGASNDDWRVVVDAPRLDALAPLLAPSAAADRVRPATAALSGSLVARAHVAGRWPNVSSEGELDGKALRFRTLAVRQASGRWRVGTRERSRARWPFRRRRRRRRRARDRSHPGRRRRDGALASRRVARRLGAAAAGMDRRAAGPAADRAGGLGRVVNGVGPSPLRLRHRPRCRRRRARRRWPPPQRRRRDRAACSLWSPRAASSTSTAQRRGLARHDPRGGRALGRDADDDLARGARRARPRRLGRRAAARRRRPGHRTGARRHPALAPGRLAARRRRRAAAAGRPGRRRRHRRRADPAGAAARLRLGRRPARRALT